MGKCVKQTTIAIIENNGKFWIGSNWVENEQKECPRKDLPSGVGYEMCTDICNQNAHAEVDACHKAGKEAHGGTLYLLGHTYCCNTCKAVMEAHGIKEVVIGKLPESISNLLDTDNLYAIVQWPETQELMEEPWFDEEAVLDVDGKFGSSAYFIPLNRL